MNIIEELEQLRNCNRRINALITQAERLEKCLKFAKNSKSVATTIDKLTKTCNEINREIDELYNEKSYLLEMIEALPETERDIIKCYYITGQSWEKVAETTYQSIRTIYRLRKTAIGRLQSLLN